MLHIYTSNRLEHLVQELATVVKIPLNRSLSLSNGISTPNPLEKEIIVVQSKGMERWLSLQLAGQLGIWTNGYFPFPEAISWRLFKDTLGHLPDTSQFSPEIMVWSLMEMLPNFLSLPEFDKLQNYLQNDERGLKRFQLASRIANTFDSYIVYRPTMLADWENGDTSAGWQAILWRELIQRYGAQHRAKIRSDFFSRIAQEPVPTRLPSRLTVFGIAALPPFYLEILAHLGKIIEVHFFVLNPCQEYWGYIASESEISRKMIRLNKEEPLPELVEGNSTLTAFDKLRQRIEPVEGNFKQLPTDLYLETGNSLLASMGKLGRDFIDMLNDYPHDIHEYFIEPDTTTLLATIQADILHLRESNLSGLPPKTIAKIDKSVQIHVCHSPMREIEVLHDQLLALFDENPDLLPKDIVIMTPDIEVYAPFIQAVFATTPDETKHIPFSIADRSPRNNSALISTFLAILELNHSRFGVSDLLSILEVETVQTHFNLTTQDIDLIRHWIKHTGIRWGIDGASRKQLGLPAFEENTWQMGLNRLLLGYALPGQNEHTFHDILPFDEVEGDNALIVGQLVTFIKCLFKTIQRVNQERTLSEWQEFLLKLLTEFFDINEENEAEAQQIRETIHHLTEYGQQANFQSTVTHEVILTYLRHYLENTAQTTHFLTGNVTFCAMLPMRNIPFKVVCLVGMNDQAFPRLNKALSFDLIAQYPKRGDRSLQLNDRYLFLETLLSARDCFYISYIGHNIHDNSLLPPSVLVSELQDYLSRNFSHPTTDILDYVITHHPLQAFSPRYFMGNNDLFSYSHEYCTASTLLTNENQKMASFLNAPLPPPPLEWNTITIDDFVKFFTNPCEFLLKKRLGIVLKDEEGILFETEPFTIDKLTNYQLNKILVEKGLAGQNLQAYYPVLKASGQLPHGQVGEHVYQQLTTQVQPFIAKVREKTAEPKLTAYSINFVNGDKRIVGNLSQLWHTHLIHYRCATLKAKDHIRLWIYHLLLNTLAEPNLPRHSLLLGEDKTWEYQAVTNSHELLKKLLALYWQGLSEPLRFFPTSSLKFAEELYSSKNNEKAFNKATAEWRGNDYQRGEMEDAYYQLCFGRIKGITPLDEQFKTIAIQVFEPLLECRHCLEE